MGKVRVVPFAGGVDFVGEGAIVRATTSAHDIRLAGPRGSLDLGALRSALLTSMGFVAEQLNLPPMGKDLTPAARALEDALADAAARKGLRDEALEAALAQIYPTPLVFSGPLLEAKYLKQDAAKFRACRVAIANAEDDFIDEDRAETAARVVEQLGRWRDLYSPTGKSKRALNAAINDFGETLAAPALWGLRRIQLTRPRTQERHLEILGWLGALPPFPGFETIAGLVERAPDAELDELLAGDAAPTPRAVAHILADGDVESSSVRRLFRSGLERRPDTLGPDQPYPPPPIAPPAIDGVRLIATPRELHAEGETMHHCVYATRAKLCADGEAYVFHVERDGAHGTVHVEKGGYVVEARGPFNRGSPAANWGAAVLGQWGLGLWSHCYDPDALCWPLEAQPPPATRPLRNVREIREAFLAAAQRTERGHQYLRDWFVVATNAAFAGKAALVATPDGTVTAIANDGRVVGDSTGLRWVTATPPPRAAPPRVARPAAVARAVARGPEAAARAWEAPPPPVPLLRMQGVRFIGNSDDLDGVQTALRVDLAAQGEAAAAGRSFLFECRPTRGVVVVEVDAAGRDVVVVGHRDVEPVDLRWAVDAIRRWTFSFWGARVGLARSAWSGAMRAPGVAEALPTVEACFTLYRQIVDRQGDNDGDLAAFFEKHVAAAVRGNAWLVVRDRAAGLVSVIDAKRRVVATTDDLVRRV